MTRLTRFQNPVAADVSRLQCSGNQSGLISQSGTATVLKALRLAVFTVAVIVGTNLSAAESKSADVKDPGAKVSEHELIRDPHFRGGFLLLNPKPPGQRVVYGELAGVEPGVKPIWDLAQWSSKFPLAVAPPQCPANGALAFTNAAKLVVIGKLGGAEADLALGVNASVEYGDRARQEGEPWVHLLVEQKIGEPPSLAELGAARFHIAARLLRVRAVKTPDYSPDRHAAQFQIFFTIQNRNPQSPGLGRLLWFGIPLYDDRHRIPIGHASKDTAGSEMFIFTPAGNIFTSASAHDGDWITVDQDIVPLLREALETAWVRGFLTESRDLGDYRVTSLNLGWEVPGIFDVEMQVRDLGLKVKFNPSGK
jgi:hypothetical protein